MMYFKAAIVAMLIISAAAGLVTIPAQSIPAQEASQQVYTNPQLFTGTLYIGTVNQLSERQLAQLEQEFDGRPKTLVVLAKRAESDDSCAASLKNLDWQAVEHHAVIGDPQTATCEALSQEFSELDSSCCVWLAENVLEECAAASRTWLSEQLRGCLQRGVTVCIECNSASTGADQRASLQVDGAIAPGMSLLPSMRLVRGVLSHQPLKADDSEDASDRIGDVGSAQEIVVRVPDDAWLRIHGRELFNLSDAASLTITWPSTPFYSDQLAAQLPARSVFDLVAAHRALVERMTTEFPTDTLYDHRLQSGSLVIVGGGGTSLEIWKEFIDLAGGESARIVVLPTAVAEPEADALEARLFARLGAAHVRVLPQIAREDVSSPEFLENFQWATGVWFGGGRQWRFVDAYWGTPAWQAIVDVTRRGGVIGGSSAGATIQGDLLVRGHPLGNHIMVADGYRRGLGLLPGVAIDQHFSQRNRFDDLKAVVKRFPAIMGIGIDEGTALVVEAPDHCSVIGSGSVWLSDPKHESREFVEHPTGSHFQLTAP